MVVEDNLEHSAGPTHVPAGRSGLKHRSTRGMLWMTSSMLVTQVLTVGTTAILAHLLNPSQFGVMSMATIATSLLSLVAELGLAQALIQCNHIEERHLSTVFWANIALSTVLGLLTVAIAPYVAAFFREPLIRPVLTVLALSFFFGTLGNVHATLLQKGMKFKQLAFIDIASVGGYAVVVLTLAWLGLGVWALVVGALLRGLIGSALPWALVPWRPRLRFDRPAFRELFGFGANILGGRVVMYLGDSVSDSILGRVLGTASLAYYNLAFQLSMMPGTKISWLLSRVMYPAFSLIQNEDAKMRQGYLKVVRYASVLAFPVSVGIMVTAPELVRLAYGEKWLSAVTPLQILAIGGVLNVLPALCGLVQNAKGRPDLALKVSLFSDSSDILLTLCGVRFGLIGVTVAHAFNKLVFLSVHVVLTCSLIGLSPLAYLSALSSAVVASGTMAVAVTAWRLLCLHTLNLSVPVILASSVGLGVTVYLLALWAMREKALVEVTQLIWQSVQWTSIPTQLAKLDDH